MVLFMYRYQILIQKVLCYHLIKFRVRNIMLVIG